MAVVKLNEGLRTRDNQIPNINKSVFVSSKELFPQWITSSIILEELINSLNGFSVQFDNITREITIFLSVNQNILHIIPPEDIEKVMSILNNTIQYYGIGIEKLFEDIRGRAMTENSLLIIENAMKENERDIFSQGGRLLKEELYFRLGVRLC